MFTSCTVSDVSSVIFIVACVKEIFFKWNAIACMVCGSSVCSSVTLMHLSKSTGQNKLPFGEDTPVAPNNIVDGGFIAHSFTGMGHLKGQNRGRVKGFWYLSINSPTLELLSLMLTLTLTLTLTLNLTLPLALTLIIAVNSGAGELTDNNWFFFSGKFEGFLKWCTIRCLRYSCWGGTRRQKVRSSVGCY